MPSLFDSLRSVLRQVDYGVLTATDDQGRVHVFVKLPRQAVQFLEGPLPLPIRHFLFMEALPTAPVVGWFIEIQDSRDPPLRVATYFNILNRDQARSLLGLAGQAHVPLYIVDGERLAIFATRRLSPPRETMRIIEEALNWAEQIPPGQYDFDRAKAEFQAAHSLDEIATWRPHRPSPG